MLVQVPATLLPSCFMLIHTARQQMKVQVLGSLPPLWETQMEFLIPGFSLALPWLLRVFGEWASWLKTFMSLFFCCFAFQVNENKQNTFSKVVFYQKYQNWVWSLGLSALRDYSVQRSSWMPFMKIGRRPLGAVNSVTSPKAFPLWRIYSLFFSQRLIDLFERESWNNWQKTRDQSSSCWFNPQWPNSPCCSRLKPGAQISIHVSYVSGRAQAPGPSATAFPGALTESWTGSGTDRTHLGCQHSMWRLNLLCHSSGLHDTNNYKKHNQNQTFYFLIYQL